MTSANQLMGLCILVDGEKMCSYLPPNLQTNGEKHCQVLADYLKKDFEGNFSEIKIVSDFADIPRFVTGFRSSLK